MLAEMSAENVCVEAAVLEPFSASSCAAAPVAVREGSSASAHKRKATLEVKIWKIESKREKM